MQVIEAQQVSALLEVEKLVEAVRDAFASDFGMPQRQVFHLDSSSDDAFAVLPAWDERYTGVKAFTYLPGNPAKGLDTLASKVLLFCRQTGAALAVVDGTELTYWRTAAVSALAADYLARKDAEVLCVCGTGRLAPYMALAHAAVRPIREIRVWGRDQTKVAAMIEQLASQERLDKIVGLIADNMRADVCSFYVLRDDGAQHIREHERVHVDDKPHHCLRCFSSFKRKHRGLRHRNRVAPCRQQRRRARAFSQQRRLSTSMARGWPCPMMMRQGGWCSLSPVTTTVAAAVSMLRCVTAGPQLPWLIPSQ